MLEIEVKYLLQDAQRFETLLAPLGARPVEQRIDADHYFNAPDRDFATTDEAFRVRRIGQRTFLTYKGPKIDQQTKTRLEIEVPLADGDAAAQDIERLLIHLGYKPVAVVRKHRKVFELDRQGFTVHVCRDEVDEVGSYAEIEIVADEAKLEPAKTLVRQIASELGLTTTERRSYLQLLLSKRG